MKKTTLLIGLVLVAAIVAGNSGAGLVFNPGDYTSKVDNPWLPLLPGTTSVYIGIKDGQAARDVEKVTNRTEKIAGVPCVVVEDT